MVHTEWPRFYGVSAANRAPLIDFMLAALEAAGCRIIYRPPANRAPFVVTFETPDGERAGIVAYAFLANNERIKHRPDDEHRFQIKYGGDLSGVTVSGRIRTASTPPFSSASTRWRGSSSRWIQCCTTRRGSRSRWSSKTSR